MSNMAYTNFPHGFPYGSTMQNIPVAAGISGKSSVFWVDSNAAGNGDGSFAKPFQRISYALNYCTANNGDVIYCAAGHHEDTQAIFETDVDGLSIIGLGISDQQPSFSVSGTLSTATWLLSGSNMYFENLKVYCNNPNLISGVTITGSGNILNGCKIVQQGYAALRGITLSGAAHATDDTVISNCEITLTTDTQGTPVTPLAAIYLTSVADSVKLVGNNISGSYSSAAILDSGNPALTNIYVYGNVVTNNVTGAGMNLGTAARGKVVNNSFGASTPWTTAGFLWCINNQGSTTLNTGSSQVPAA